MTPFQMCDFWKTINCWVNEENQSGNQKNQEVVRCFDVTLKGNWHFYSVVEKNLTTETSLYAHLSLENLYLRKL